MRMALPGRLKLYLKLIGVLLAANFLMRFAFAMYNLNALEEGGTGALILGFIVGVRFDLAVIFISNILFLLLLVIPFRQNVEKVMHFILIPLIWVINAVILLLNGIDVVYFSTASKRLSHELFTAAGDLTSFDMTTIRIYLWLFLFFVTVSALLWISMRKISKEYLRGGNNVPESLHIRWGIPVILLAFMIVGIRGGFQLRPLRPADAFVTTSLFAGNTGLNSAYTVLSSIDIGMDEPVEFMSEADAREWARKLYKNDYDREFISDEYPLLRETHFEEDEKRYNVVILIIESFNAKKIGVLNGSGPENTLTPNFDRLSRDGLLFTNFYSNGCRSVQALPAILNSIPEIFARPTIGSSYETNNVYGLPKMLAKRGYASSFFCGGPNGTMGFDSYSKIAGIKKYYGWNEYPDSKTDNYSQWGVHDGPFLKWVGDMHDKNTEPFFSVWFSISNHFPFTVPLDCPKEITDKYSDMDMTVRYTDLALGEYFENAKKNPSYERTLFFVTGDHCYYGNEDPWRPMMDNFRVPLLIIGPGIESGLSDRLGTHLDIAPTIIDLLKLKTKHSSAGISLFSKTNQPVALSNLMDIMTIARGEVSWSTTFEQEQPAYIEKDGKWESLKGEELANEKREFDYENALRALYQVSHNVRIQNKLFPKISD